MLKGWRLLVTPLGLIDCVDHVGVCYVFDLMAFCIDHNPAAALIKRNAVA
jgi:hypothetical protein